MPYSSVGDVLQRERTGSQHLASATRQSRLAKDHLLNLMSYIRVLDEAAVCLQGFWIAT